MIQIENLTVAYARHPAIHHLSGGFERGSMTAVVGPNGAGKSTLLKAIMGWLPLAQGGIRLAGIDRSQIAYLPQQAEIDRSFPVSVLDTVLMGHWRNRGAFAALRRREHDMARAALAAVGLAGFEARYLVSLSAGQFQRVLFARLMLQDAPLLLLDEPFSAIDERTTHSLLDLVCHWHDEHRTVVAVLHDLDQVREWFPHTLLLARDAIAWGRTADVLTPDNLLQARRMAEAWDVDAPVCERPVH